MAVTWLHRTRLFDCGKNPKKRQVSHEATVGEVSARQVEIEVFGKRREAQTTTSG
jgi:hypothetical protein